MFVPFVTCLAYGETSAQMLIAFVAPMLVGLGVGYILTRARPASTTFFAKEGLLIVGFSWIVISLLGALPFQIATLGDPNFADMTFVDWLFESVSGFTTTGSTVLHTVEGGHQIDLMAATGYRGLLMWRSLTHWLGGMGVLIFILAVLPSSSGASAIHIMQAESTGPSVGKLVSRVSSSARILYLIYAVMTVALVGLLALDMPLPSDAPQEVDFYNALILSFGTAGTGGFAATSASLGACSLYVQIVVTVFMFLFGVNFNLYFMILIGKFTEILKSEELRFYVLATAVAIVSVTFNVWATFAWVTEGEMTMYNDFGSCLQYASFSVVSCMTSTGFSTADFALWPAFSRIVLLILMFIGACAGSTGGGFKCSRFLILIKSILTSCRRILNPHAVYTVKMNGKKLDDNVVRGVYGYFFVYLLILVGVTVILCFDVPAAAGNDPILTSFTSVLACLNNIGPGITQAVGPSGDFYSFHIVVKLILSLVMLLGRLEIYPILMLFSPKTYTRQ